MPITHPTPVKSLSIHDNTPVSPRLRRSQQKVIILEQMPAKVVDLVWKDRLTSLRFRGHTFFSAGLVSYSNQRFGFR
jgi:hypothetical protein